MPLATPTILLGFLLPWTWGISSSCSSRVQPLLLTLHQGYLLTAVPPELEHGVALSALLHPCSHHSLDVGLLLLAASLTSGMGNSSQPLLCHCILAVSATAPDLALGVAPLGLPSAVQSVEPDMLLPCGPYENLRTFEKKM